MQTQKIIKWGIIGCGDVTEVKSGPAFNQVSNSQLVAVMRRTPELAKDYAIRHKVPKWYSNADDLINDFNVDAIYIATPPSSHKYYTLKCAEVKKPVYVEKPMALNFNECSEMIRACNNSNTPLFVAYYRRSLPKFIKIKELIYNDNAIGTPRYLNCVLHRPHEVQYQNPNELPWIVKPEISGGGIFVDIACHTLDILDFIFGQIKHVNGYSSSQLKAYPAEDCVSMAFIFKNGVQGTGIWNFGSYNKYDNVVIVGDRGKLSFSTFGNNPIILDTVEGTQEFMYTNPNTIEQYLINDVVQELIGTGSSPSTGITAARTSWVMDQVLKQRINV
jgi:predicted dehydrogenase